MKVTPIAITKSLVTDNGRELTQDELIVYIARVSNPQNQDNHSTGARLLRYCIQHGHWSIFEQASMTMEIETSRAIAAQILRHRSFSFQEFSQRYSDVTKLGLEIAEIPELRGTHAGGNRQGSAEDIGDRWYLDGVVTLNDHARSSIDCSISVYRSLIEAGVAPESARMVLPLCVRTRLYMTGSVRSWIHYFEQRRSMHAQKEHRQVADEAYKVFQDHFPTVCAALEDNQ